MKLSLTGLLSSRSRVWIFGRSRELLLRKSTIHHCVCRCSTISLRYILILSYRYVFMMCCLIKHRILHGVMLAKHKCNFTFILTFSIDVSDFPVLSFSQVDTFCVATPCSVVVGYLYLRSFFRPRPLHPEDGGSIDLWNCFDVDIGIVGRAISI
jgi:hypothetical protein